MEIGEVRYARQDGLVVLENFHAIKHALRFGAHLLGAWTADLEELDRLSADLAPDVHIPAELVDLATLKQVAPRGQVVAVARPPEQASVDAVLAGPGHVVFLENPAHLGNLGAAVRVAAAAGAAAVMTTGRHDPWHPDALRGSAGLHYALPVHHLRTRLTGDRPLVALDPDGDVLSAAALSSGAGSEPGDGGEARWPDRAVLAFGTERGGLSDELLAAADHRIALPMAPGVSSMNLATAVAATLYALKLARP